MSKARIPVGVVGGGRVGESFTKQLQAEPDIAVTGIVTSTAARRQELATKLGVPAFADVPALMAATPKPLVVCVVNANDQHAPATIAALKAGAHVYCEKPMAPTWAECKAMVRAEQRSGRHLQIGFEYMHGTMTSRLRQLVADGYFGELTWASVLDSRGHWWSDAPDVDASTIWKLDRQRGGGIIFHCGIHQLDMIRCYLGPITEVTAYRPPRNALPFYPADVPDNVTLMLRAQSGAVCNFQVFHNRAPTYYREMPRFNPDWRQVPGHEFSVALVGTRGSCLMQIYGETLHLFRFDLANKDTVFDRTEVFSPNPPDKSHHNMRGLLLRFIRSVAGGGGAIDPATEALATMRLAFAAEDAIAQGGGTVRVARYR
jgi:predicted dehydrogenase